ncbi:MAG: molybdopterin oxidoreductase family protein [Rhodospirillales bacterium]|nr:molybdopterin oxidoreductase family protein [Alphaproteobacteria bacterium]MBL6948190.1 molybdopterin oxidoreductase family protein [Rhodospirillales bacterium]
MTSEFVSSACPHDCPSTCALEVERLDDYTIGKVRGAADNDYTLGVICDKVARYRERIHHPERLSHPLKRSGPKGSGRFEPISWDEALDEVAAAFKAAADEFGAEAVWPFHYAGTMGLVQRDGIHRFRHALGYSGLDETICVTLARMGWYAGVGKLWGTDARDMAQSDLIVIWGTNPVSTQVNVMTHVTKARKERGAKVVCVDPYRTGTAKAADIHLAVRPGTDGALACGVMHVLFREGFADRDYMARFTDDPERLEKHLETRTPAWAADITGLAEEDIVAFARLYGQTERSYIRVGYGFSRSRNGAANVHAVTCLPAVTGTWQHPGGGALYVQADLYNIDQTVIKGLDVVDPEVRILDMSRIGAVLTGDKGALKGGPPVKAMLIQNQNPAMVAPDSVKVLQGLKREDLFICVHEQFMTETAELADIVLPATMFLEHDDMYKGSGHPYLQVTKKVIEAPAECRSNHEVHCALAERLGAEHPGFAMSAWELMDQSLKASGLPGADDALKARWIDCSKSSDEMNFLNGFGHADGRFRFAPDWRALGQAHGTAWQAMPALPDHLDNIDAADKDHPFRLVTAPARRFLNSTFTETETSRTKEGRPTAFINPADCEALGLSDGERVRIGNRQGDVVVHVKPYEGQQPGVVVIESIWPNKAFVEGLGINALTSADSAPPAGGAVFHDTAVWLRAEPSGEGM